MKLAGKAIGVLAKLTNSALRLDSQLVSDDPSPKRAKVAFSG